MPKVFQHSSILLLTILLLAPTAEGKQKRKGSSSSKKPKTSITSKSSKPLVSFENGKLKYGKDKYGDMIPDFSYAGYRGGGVKLPTLPVKVTLRPTKNGDDTQRIQKAIDKVAGMKPDRNGFKGAVLLKAGTYRAANPIKLRASGVVLRGEGQHAKGTTIIATAKKQYSLIEVGGGRAASSIKDAKRAVSATKPVPVGTKSIPLTGSSGRTKWSKGEWIRIVRHPNQAWIAEIGMDKLKRRRKSTVNWTPQAYTLSYDRKLEGFNTRSLTIDAPTVFSIDKKWGGATIYKLEKESRIREVGVENLHLKSAYVKKGRRGTDDEDHAWNGIYIKNTINGWVRNVTARHFGYSCVSIVKSVRQVTVQDCAYLDPISKITGARRYSFNLNGERCLVQRCYSRSGRHCYVNGDRVTGPSVFLDCVADNTHSDTGPHHRWTTGILYDNIKCGPLNVRNRGESGTGHGWVGSIIVCWNCRADSMRIDSPPTINNYAFGCIISGRKKRIDGNGYHYATGKPMKPRSLYLAQLKERLGPKAVENITTQAQRSGIIDEKIKQQLGK